MALQFDDLWRDLRLAAGGLWRSPRFTAAVVLTLAIGTGATTALFSVVDAVLIRPLPYPNSDRIVRIQGNGPQAFVLFGGPRLFQLSVPELGSNGAIQHVGVSQVGGLNLGVEPAVRLRAAAVSPAFFEVMGINAARGRTFSEGDVGRSAQIAVLSHRTWRARFAGDPNITSRAIVLNGRPFDVVGVMPAAFDFPTGTEIWIPNGGDAQIAEGVYTPGIVARLVPAVSYQQARDAIGRTIRSSERYEKAVVEIVSLRTILVGEIRPTILAVAAGALLLLLVACANAAHLLLARVGARSREFSVRRAVGASRPQLAQQVLCEGFVLSTIASVGAMFAAQWSVDALRSMIPETIYGAAAIDVNLRTLVATGALGVAITIGFAGGPALSVAEACA